MSAGSEDGEPMVEMNTTPLIDVMLVLLIMFIITIPIQTHAVKIDLPQNAPPTDSVIDPVKNKVAIDPSGVITWNGSAIDLLTLRQYLQQSLRLRSEEHTSELQSLMRISYAVFCLNKTPTTNPHHVDLPYIPPNE